MGFPPEDPLEVLAGHHGPAARRAAGQVTDFMRLLSADARATEARSVQVDHARARVVLEQRTRELLGAAVEDLLRHHLRAHLGGESFAWHGEPRASVQDAWRVLARAREELSTLPGVPGPGETALSVALRLCDALERLGGDEERCGLWRARLVHAERGPRDGEAAFRALLAADEDGPSRALRAALTGGLAECLLDRARVREAAILLEEQAVLVRGDERLRRLLAWSRLLAGDAGAARRTLEGAGPWRGPIPAPLVELRERTPGVAALLSGRALPAPSGGWEWPSAQPGARTDLGAAVLCAFAFAPDRTARPLRLDVAPALRDGVDAWLSEREDACAVTDQPEHALVIEARPWIAHRLDGHPLAGALGRERTLALALAPVLDEEGEVVGWLHVECEHHLLPSARAMARLTRGFASRILRASQRAPAEPRAGAHSLDRVREVRLADEGYRRAPAGSEPAASLAEPARGLCGEVFEALVAALGVKTARRRWWGFDACGQELRLAAEGGEGLAAGAASAGGRAIARCRATGGTVCFEERDQRLSLHPDASSGVALALRSRGELCGVLALESECRRDFRARDVARFEQAAGAFALALRVAQLRGWHLARFGYDLYFDTSLPGFGAFAEQLIAAGRSRAPVVVSGEKGSGKLVLARWLHFESGRAECPLTTIPCGLPGEGDAARLPFEEPGAGGGSLLLDDVDELSAGAQQALLRRLDAPEPERARILATSRRPLAEAVERGDLHHALAARLDRLQVFVPPLAGRREEIPGLVRFLARRFATEEGTRPPRFTDDALALLWRQPWPGNLRELEGLVFKIVLIHPGRELDAGAVAEVARSFRSPLLKKIPSRHPRRAALVSALRSTFKAGDRINKRRAAAYLGWDPGTLATRLREAGLDRETLEAEPSAWVAPPP